MPYKDPGKHRARKTVYQKAYYEANREKILAKNKISSNAYREANQEKVLASVRCYRAANKEKILARNRIRKFGTDGSELIDQQNGACAICGIPFANLASHKIHIDHCHVSGIVRGVLCSACNVALGLAKDNPETLRAMATYVEKWQVFK